MGCRERFGVFNLSGNSLVTFADIIEERGHLLGCWPAIGERDSAAVSLGNPDNRKAREVLRW